MSRHLNYIYENYNVLDKVLSRFTLPRNWVYTLPRNTQSVSVNYSFFVSVTFIKHTLILVCQYYFKIIEYIYNQKYGTHYWLCSVVTKYIINDNEESTLLKDTFFSSKPNLYLLWDFNRCTSYDNRLRNRDNNTFL